MAKFSIDELLMGRVKQSELSAELLDNARKLISKINALMLDLGVKEPKFISSGYRRPDDNKKAGGSLNSPHLRCLAVDIADVGQHLSTLIASKPDLLRKHDLWLENPLYTPTWCHIDAATRKDRPSRVFNP